MKPGFEIAASDIVIEKDVNSGFVGTSLEILLRRAGIQRLVVVGFLLIVALKLLLECLGIWALTPTLYQIVVQQQIA